MAELADLRRHIEQLERVVVAFSGGADSSLLAWVANDVLGPARTLVVTAVSPSLSKAALADCRLLAQEWQFNYVEVNTHEDELPGYVANGPDRCWYCKDELMRRLVPLTESSLPGARNARVLLGVNLDDLGEHRPGQLAARKAGAVFPLVDAGFTKADVREVSRALGLRTWDKPAAPCLASRLPYGTAVTARALGMVAKAESALMELGFSELRVRHYGDLARVELPLAQLGRALSQRAQVVRAVKSAGYHYVTLDLEGLRSGNLSAFLTAKSALPNDKVLAPQGLESEK
ncbi:MAG: ATP-dependent sacrificial sulfur transferase LarE [Acidimicrobiales bacterium]